MASLRICSLNDSFLPFYRQPSKKWTYGKNSSLSRKKKRGTAKTVQPGAHKAAFVRQRQYPTPSAIPAPKCTSQQKIKALTNALQYQGSKSSAASDTKVSVLQEEVAMKDHEADLRNIEIAHLPASVEWTKQTLEHRTSRFIAYNEKRISTFNASRRNLPIGWLF